MRHLRTLCIIIATALLLGFADFAGATATAITPTLINRTTAGGIDYDTYVLTAPSGGNYWTNDGQQFLLVDNGDSNPMTVTVAWGSGTLAAVDGVSATARTYTVAAGKKRLIGPFPPLQYNDASGRVQVTYSAVTSLKVGVFTFTPEKQQ